MVQVDYLQCVSGINWTFMKLKSVARAGGDDLHRWQQFGSMS